MSFRNSILRLVGAVVLVVGVLCLVDMGVECATKRTALVTEAVDIQTPSILYSKLRYLRSFQGKKVVLLGDSVVFGHALKQHGDDAWREHTLGALLKERIEKVVSEPVLVMNLGMNGALPTDLERMAKLVVPCNVDLIVLDVGLRSFSADFSLPGAVLSRRWLEKMAIDGNGRFAERCESTPCTDRMETGIRSFLINHWALYRLRDFYQYRVLGGQPREFCVASRDAVNQWLTSAGQEESGGGDGLILLMKARMRFDSINLDPGNEQRKALCRLLAYLKEANQTALVFYAKEDPESVGFLIEPKRYEELSRQLAALVRAEAGQDSSQARIQYLPPLEELQPEHYLDHVHVDRNGNKIYVDAIWDRVSGAFDRPRSAEP